MRNERIREWASIRQVKLWEIAEKLGCTDTTFSKRMRRELPEEEQARIIDLIDQIADERGAD